MNTFRAWIRKGENQETLGLDVASVQVLISEMTTNPIGIGQGVFYLDPSYAFKVHIYLKLRYTTFFTW